MASAAALLVKSPNRAGYWHANIFFRRMEFRLAWSCGIAGRRAPHARSRVSVRLFYLDLNDVLLNTKYSSTMAQ